MKLILAIISSEDANSVLKELIKNNFFVTKLSSSGGFLKAGNTTLLIGVENESIASAIEIISKFSKTRKTIVPNSLLSEYGPFTSNQIEVSIGGGTIFVLNVESFTKL